MSVGVALGVEGRGSCSSSEKVLPLHVHIPPSTQEGRWIYAEEGKGSALLDSREMKLICMLSSPNKIPHTGKTGSGTITLSIQRGSKITQQAKVWHSTRELRGEEVRPSGCWGWVWGCMDEWNMNENLNSFFSWVYLAILCTFTSHLVLNSGHSSSCRITFVE